MKYTIPLYKAMSDTFGVSRDVRAPGATGPGNETQSMPDFRIYQSPESKGTRKREQEAAEIRMQAVRKKHRGFWGAPPREPTIRYTGEQVAAYVERGPKLANRRPSIKGPKAQVKRLSAARKDYKSEELDRSRKKSKSRKLVARRQR